MRQLAALILTLGMLAACGAAASPSPSPSPSAPSSVVPASPIEGLVVGIDSAGPAKVQGFSLRTSSGATYEFKLGTLENGAEFPPGHLAEHRATAEPVRVTFHLEGDNLVATRIDDASSG